MIDKNNIFVSRRRFLQWSAVGIGGAAIAACGAPAAPAAAPEEAEMPAEETVTISWWHQWGGTTGMAAMEGVAAAFNEEDRNVKVERLHVIEMNDKLLAAIAGGTPPDVGVCCVEYAELFSRGAVMAIDDRIDNSDVVGRDDFVPGLLESMQWQGATYGVPGFEAGPRYGLMYNKAIIDEAGLDPENLPHTWDEMFEWHVELTQFDAAGNVEIVGFDPRDATAGVGPATNIPQFWALTYGLDMWDDETNAFNYDNELFVRALNTIKRFTDHVGVQQMESFRSSFGGWTQSPSSSFPSGVQAMIVTGYYAPGELFHSAPDKEFGVGWVPVSEDRSDVNFQNVGGHPMYIPNGVTNVDAAFEFIEFCSDEKAQNVIFDSTGWLGGRKALYDPDLPKYQRYENLDWFLRSVNEADELWACPVIPIQGFVNQQRSRTYESVIFGDKDAEEAAADMQAACTEELLKQFPELVG